MTISFDSTNKIFYILEQHLDTLCLYIRKNRMELTICAEWDNEKILFSNWGSMPEERFFHIRYAVNRLLVEPWL